MGFLRGGGLTTHNRLPAVRGPFIEKGDRFTLKCDVFNHKAGAEGTVIAKRGVGIVKVRFDDGFETNTEAIYLALWKFREASPHV